MGDYDDIDFEAFLMTKEQMLSLKLEIELFKKNLHNLILHLNQLELEFSHIEKKLIR